jgi:hypothetical protein
LFGHAIYAADPLATIGTLTDTFHAMGTLERRGVKVPWECEMSDKETKEASQ